MGSFEKAWIKDRTYAEFTFAQQTNHEPLFFQDKKPTAVDVKKFGKEKPRHSEGRVPQRSEWRLVIDERN